MMKEKRGYKRFIVCEIVSSIAQTEDGFMHLDSVVVDISSHGLSMRTISYLPPGTPVLTMMPFRNNNGVEEEAALVGTVSWNQWDESNYLMGITFEDELLPENDGGLINHYFRSSLQ